MAKLDEIIKGLDEAAQKKMEVADLLRRGDKLIDELVSIIAGLSNEDPNLATELARVLKARVSDAVVSKGKKEKDKKSPKSQPKFGINPLISQQIRLVDYLTGNPNPPADLRAALRAVTGEAWSTFMITVKGADSKWQQRLLSTEVERPDNAIKHAIGSLAKNLRHIHNKTTPVGYTGPSDMLIKLYDALSGGDFEKRLDIISRWARNRK